MQASDASTRHGLIFLLRRLRRPLLVLLCVYSACTLGFVLVPGRTPDGALWHMTFLQATYFVSFLGTFRFGGEIACLYIFFTRHTDDFALGRSLCQCRKIDRVGTHISDFSRLIQLLSHHHGLRNREAKFAGSFLLQCGGGKRWCR